MLTLNDGRTELWQWDNGRTLAVDADCSQVHFSNKVFGRSIDVDVIDGAAIIPDILLQTDKDLNVWAFVGTAENGYTKISKTFKVNRRNKPSDYVFTPVEQTTIAEIAAIAQSVRDDADAGLFDGRDGVDGYTPIKGVDYFDGKDGAPGHTPEYGVDYGTPEQIAGIAQQAADILQPDLSQIDASLSDKLPKSPASWEPWTAEEQAEARERLHGSFEKIIYVTLEEDVAAGITFAYDADGNDINAQDICVDVYLPVEYTQNNINFRVRLTIGNENLDSFRAFNAGGLLNCRQRFMMFSIGELRVPVHGTPTTNLGYINVFPAHIASSFSVIPGSVSQIFIELYGGMLPAGSIIEIYAR